MDFAKYDLFLSKQVAHFLGRLNEYKDRNGSVLGQHHRDVRQRREHDAQLAQPADAGSRRREHGPQARDILARRARPACRTCT